MTDFDWSEKVIPIQTKKLAGTLMVTNEVYKEAIRDQLEQIFLYGLIGIAYKDRNPFPTFSLFPRLKRLEEKHEKLNADFRNFNRRLVDARAVLSGRETIHCDCDDY